MVRTLTTAVTALVVAGLLVFGNWQAVWAGIAPVTPVPSAEFDEFDTEWSVSTPVYAVLEANDRYYIGGNFATAAGESQPFLAAIDAATGQLDPQFRPQILSDDPDVTNRGVKSLAISPDGTDLFVGGYFSQIDGVARSRIAKLDAVTGEVDSAFNPGASAVVEAIETDGTSVWVGGVFNTLAGELSPHLGKLDAATGAADPSWTTHTNTVVYDLHIVGSTLYVAGNFVQVGPYALDANGDATFDGAVTVDRAARVDLASGAVAVDAAGNAEWAPAAEHRVFEIDANADGSLIYLAGAGPKDDGGNSLRAIDGNTGAEVWRRVNGGDYQAIAVTDDAVYAGTHGNWVFDDPNGELCEGFGCFEESPGVFVDNPNAVHRPKLSAYDPATGELLDWNPTANSSWGVWALETGPSGLLVGGDFTEAGGINQSHFAVFRGPDDNLPQSNITVACADGPCSYSPQPDLPALVVGADTVSVNGTSAIAVIPPEAEPGDLAIAFVTVSDNSTTVSAPTGWQLIGDNQGTQIQSMVYTSTIGVGEPGTAAEFTTTSQTKTSVTLAAVRTDVGTPAVAAITSEVETLERGAHTAPALTYSGEATVLNYWADRSSGTSRIVAPGDHITLAEATDDGGGHITTVLSAEPTANIDASDSTVAVANSANKQAIGWSIALTEGTPPPVVDLTPADGTVERVVHLSLDGLASGYITPENTPNLIRLLNEGTGTLNARTDGDFTKTMPNHFSQLSGRPVLGDGGHGITFNQWDPDTNTNTVHDEAGEYVASVFDVVHDHSLGTAAFVSKEKMEMINHSWGANGAPDLVGTNDGTNKIDTFARNAPSLLMGAVIDELETNDPAYTFVHLRTPDEVGHSTTWGSPAYTVGVQQTDQLVGDLISAITWNEDLAGTTALIITADHGGPLGGNLHSDETDPDNYTIPFLYWGPTISSGTDMYADEAGVRTDPGTAQVPNAGGVTTEPIRDHDAGNLALELLGLPQIEASHYNLGAQVTGPEPEPDTTPPTVSLTTPTAQDAGVIDLTGDVTDDISGVDRVRVRIRNQQTGEYWDGTAWTPTWRWNLATLNGDDTWTLPGVDVTAAADYKVILWAWDDEGNLADWSANPQPVLTVTDPNAVPDTSAPDIVLATALSQSPAVIDIDATVTDDLSGVERVRVMVRNISTAEYWNGTTWQAGWSWNVAALSGADTWRLPEVDLTQPGTYQTRLYAWDNENNRAITGGTDPQNQITVTDPDAAPDTTPPVVVLATAGVQAPGILDIDATVTDDKSGVDRVRFMVRNIATAEYWNGTTWQPSWIWNLADPDADDTWTLPTVDLTQPGSYQVRMYAWDGENNRTVTGGTDPVNRITVSE